MDWGDGAEQTFSPAAAAHEYKHAGTYTITITAGAFRLKFHNTDARTRIRTIEQWGTVAWQSMEQAFYGCSNLQINAEDSPDLSRVTSLNSMFRNATVMNASLSHWVVSGIENMAEMFSGANAFNGSLAGWDVSGVTDMRSMFYQAYAFNQPLDGWKVSNVMNMTSMFRSAETFNQPLDGWDVSGAANMAGMFARALAFDKPLNSWKVANVTDMRGMFFRAEAFNQDLGAWDISNVTDLSFMFSGVTLSAGNYDALLLGWSRLPVQSGISFDAGNSQYNGTAAVIQARQTLLDAGWSIDDGGQAGG